MTGAQRVKMEAETEVLEAKKEESERGDDDADRIIDETAAPHGASHDAEEEEGDLNAYELERERNIARNRARMDAVVGESRRVLAATTKRAAASANATSGPRRCRRPRPPAPAEEARRIMPTRASRRLERSSSSRSPSPDRTMNRTPPDCSRAAISRSARPVIPARFVRGVPSNPGTADDAEALRQLNAFRTSYMSRAALFNRVMAVSNALKLEDFAEVLEREDQRDLAGLAREKLVLMKKGNPAAVREFVLRSKEREYERREREAEVEAEEEEGE